MPTSALGTRDIEDRPAGTHKFHQGSRFLYVVLWLVVGTSAATAPTNNHLGACSWISFADRHALTSIDLATRARVNVRTNGLIAMVWAHLLLVIGRRLATLPDFSRTGYCVATGLPCSVYENRGFCADGRFLRYTRDYYDNFIGARSANRSALDACCACGGGSGTPLSIAPFCEKVWHIVSVFCPLFYAAATESLHRTEVPSR